ncbi:MAG: glycoside hydrolase family 88 protein [Planctomycetota bacterium]|nr:MAG: glycoside hydrolase family 88 protein [Planctomycetota bacterium]
MVTKIKQVVITILLTCLSASAAVFGAEVIPATTSRGPTDYPALNTIDSDIFSPEKIIAIMKKVNNYTFSHPYQEHDRNWIRATYYTGVMALYKTSQDPKVLEQAMRWSTKHNWLEGGKDSPPNKLTCGQTYLELYFIKQDPSMIAPLGAWVDSGKVGSPSSTKLWYKERGRRYADSLYVAPPTLAMLGKATGRNRYYEYMNNMYWDVVDHLFDKEFGLFYRDKRFIKAKNRNGKKIFWSRGNGWVIAGIPRVLQYLPEDDPYYKRYVSLLKTMAVSIAKAQGEGGLWRTNLADADEFPGPETSGSAFFCYAMAWGINNGHLEHKKFLPVVRKAWQGLVSAVHKSGKLGWVQRVAAGPSAAAPGQTHEYAVGAFLLAGSEMAKLAKAAKGKHQKATGILPPAVIETNEVAANSYPLHEKSIISLAGQWSFRLDPDNKGIEEQWFKNTFSDKVRLPGTTDENRKGNKNEECALFHLSRLYIYTGPAWYQREVNIPDNWAGKRITLFMGRSKRTRVWVDDKFAGTDHSFSTPQVYDLTNSLTPGKHVITIQVDNADYPPMGHSHAITEHTQTNWNGIVGKIQLQAYDPVWIEDVKIYPDIKNTMAKLSIKIGNITGRSFSGTLTITAESINVKSKHSIPAQTIDFDVTGGNTGVTVETDYDMGPDVLLWDEFSPAMYKLTVSLSAGIDNTRSKDSKTINFGMREFATKGTQFAINGRTTFLRGKVDNCVFPLTAYAPMKKADWLRVFRIAKSYGINHYRFHSWCPPEAAFDAADEVGIYLQPELPTWSAFGVPKHDTFMEAEGYRILDAYGNHPSFVMFALGNELRGKREIMANLVHDFREKDPRRLYAQGSNNFFSNPGLPEGDDYWTTFMTSGKWTGNTDQHRYGAFVRGAFDQHTRGHVNNRPPSTMTDYRESIKDYPVPIVGHEIASYEIYPNFKEIKKYTGVLRARNFDVFRQRLVAKHMLDQADDFFRASGALSVICHREEVEAALRTQGFGGFQMLALQDFPGQGTALVGMLDAFMDSKGLITPEAWREFCSPTVPLIRMPKYTWTTNETFIAKVEVAHYGPNLIEGVIPTWLIEDRHGKIISTGRLPKIDIPQGKLFSLGNIGFPLDKVTPPQKLSLEIRIRPAGFVNHYDIWVYPDKTDTTPPNGVTIRQTFDDKTQQLLTGGGKVLLLPKLDDIKHSIAGAFQTNFWCYPYFKKYNPPGSNGILCDPKHPALAKFPTQFHSNWQWWHLVKRARPIILDETPPDYRPIVQVIDNFERNHKMGILFETKIGPGRLLICSSDLLGLQEEPETRQYLYSLLAYMDSDRFQPSMELDIKLIRQWLVPPDKNRAR